MGKRYSAETGPNSIVVRSPDGERLGTVIRMKEGKILSVPISGVKKVTGSEGDAIQWIKESAGKKFKKVQEKKPLSRPVSRGGRGGGGGGFKLFDTLNFRDPRKIGKKEVF